MRWIKRLFCKHEYEFNTNLFGDEINLSGGFRSLWKCKKCGKIQGRKYLVKNTEGKVITPKWIKEMIKELSILNIKND